MRHDFYAAYMPQNLFVVEGQRRTCVAKWHNTIAKSVGHSTPIYGSRMGPQIDLAQQLTTAGGAKASVFPMHIHFMPKLV